MAIGLLGLYFVVVVVIVAVIIAGTAM